MISAENITVAFGDNVVLHDASLEIPSSGIVGIVGPNGCGKTTLMRTLYHSLTPDKGNVKIDGEPLSSFSRKTLAKKLAVVVQEHASDMPMSVAEMVMLGRLPHQGFSGNPSKEDEAIVADVLDRVGLLHKATEDYLVLSGGERQRALIARALAQNSEHILLDEPTNHLDIHYQHEVLALVAELQGSVGVVLHDLNLAARYCDSVVILNSNGSIVTQGPPAEVFTPEILEPVYRIRVNRVDIEGEVNLLFSRAAA